MTQAVSVGERMRLVLQHVLPHHLLTRIVGAAARWQWRPWSRFLIRRFHDAYRPDMSEAACPELTAYPSFNAFFTRPLRAGARSVDADPASVCCPVDGVVSNTGVAERERLIQAKHLEYGLDELVGDAEWTESFLDGPFATLYLSPSHYHRVHMPLDGELRRTIHVPGRLFSVAPFTVRGVPRLFCRNERLVCLFDTPAGRMASIMVGAMLVAGVATVWGGDHGHVRRAVRRDYGPGQVRLERGAEMGRFNMGSTVILLFEPGRVAWRDALLPGDPVRLGERLGKRLGRRVSRPS